MATRKRAETVAAEAVARDPERALEVFQRAKSQYLGSDTTPDSLLETIAMFELAASLDPANRDAIAYLNFAMRDLNGLQKKKRGVVGHRRARARSAPKEDAILVAYETEEEANNEEDVELYGEDEEAETPPWDPVKGEQGEEESRPWEEA